jgi:YHS domain-containing protein
MEPNEQPANDQPARETAIDPVCGAIVDVATAQYSTNYDDGSPNWTTYYFDSDECKQLFERDPERYVKAGK